MNLRHQRADWAVYQRALTFVELLVTLALGVVLFLMILPSPRHGMSKAKRIQCVSNLKNIGLAFRVFATDHNDVFPMSLAVTNGGTREWVDDPAKVWLHYFVMSNQVATPGLLVCPTDQGGRLKATSFATNLSAAASFRVIVKGQETPFSNNRNLSYFVGVASDETRPNMLLAGDRNLTNGEPMRFEYGRARVGNLGTNHLNQPGAAGAGWDRNMHNCAGNVVNADGSVQQYTSSRLREALRNSGDADNRLAVPD